MKKLLALAAIIVVLAFLGHSYINKSGFFSLEFAGEGITVATVTNPSPIYSDNNAVGIRFDFSGLDPTKYSLYFVLSSTSSYIFPGGPFPPGSPFPSNSECMYKYLDNLVYCCRAYFGTSTETIDLNLTQILSGTSRNESWAVFADLNTGCDKTKPPAPTTKIATIPVTILSATPSITNIIAIDTNTGLALGSISKKKQFGIQATINSKPVTLDCNTSIDGVLASTRSIAVSQDTNSYTMLSTYGPLPKGSHTASVSCTNKSSGTSFTGTNSLSFSVVDVAPTASGIPAVSPHTGAYNDINYSCSLQNMQIADEDDGDANILKSYSWTNNTVARGTGQSLKCTSSTCPVGSALTCSVAVSNPGGTSVTQTSAAVLIESRIKVRISSEGAISTSEGAKVTFNPTFTFGSPNGQTAYVWVFGDGNSQTLTASGSTPPTISHAYYKKDSGQATYHAVLSVTDSNGNTATDSVDVVVQDAQLVISVEEPANEDRFGRMNSASPMKLLVKLKDSSGNLVSGGSVYATIAGSKLSLPENADKSYGANYVPKWNDPYSNSILFDANAVINGMQRSASDSSRIVYFDRDQFDVNVLEPSPAIFATERIAKLKFFFLYPDKSRVQDINSSDVKAVWMPTGKEISLIKEGSVFSGDLNYEPTESDITKGTLFLSLTASDRAGNKLGRDGTQTIEFELKSYDVNFYIDNSIANSLGSTFAYGQNARFEASLKAPKDANNVQVYLDSAALAWHKQFSFDKNSGKWVLETRVPSETEFAGSEFDLSVGASAFLNGNRIIAAPVKGSTDAKLSNQLEVSLVNPDPVTGSAVSLSEIQARINYPNGSPYDANSVSMEVNGKQVDFVKRGDVFVANYALNEGKQDLAIKPLLAGNYKADEVNVKGLNVKGVSGIDPLYIAAAAVAVLILIIGIVVVLNRRSSRKTEKKIAEVKGQRSIEELEQRGAELETIIHNLELDFYHRRIQEEEYLKQRQQYSAEQKEVRAKIQVLKSEEGMQGQFQAEPVASQKEERPEAPPWISRTISKPKQEEQEEESPQSRTEEKEPEEPEKPKEIEEPEPLVGESISPLKPATEEEELEKIRSIASRVGATSASLPARQETQEPQKKAPKSQNLGPLVQELVEQYKDLVHKYNEEDLFNELTEELGYSAEVANEVIAKLRPKK